MTGRGDTWVLVCPPGATASLRVLVDARSTAYDVRVVERVDLPRPDEWPSLVPAGAAGVLLVGDRRRAPATVVDSPFVPDADGGWVPVGWVPLTRGLDRFAAAAAAVSGRRDPAPVATLGQRSARYQRLTDRFTHHLGDVDVVRWGSERLTREDLVAGLRSGLGVAVYLGHGRPSGWAGYRGLRAAHLVPMADRPVGFLLSVTCWTASRKGVGTSFCEQVVLQGSAAASLGAVRPTLHLDNTRVVVALAHALREGADTAGGLLRGMLLKGGRPLPEAATYRLCGDPLAPLGAAAGAARRAHRVYAPSPDFVPAPDSAPAPARAAS